MVVIPTTVQLFHPLSSLLANYLARYRRDLGIQNPCCLTKNEEIKTRKKIDTVARVKKEKEFGKKALWEQA